MNPELLFRSAQCGNNILFSEDFEASSDDLSDGWAGKGGADKPISMVLDTDPDGRGKSARTTQCISGGDGYSKDTFDCSWEEPCLISYWNKGNAWQGVSEAYPGPHTWTAVPDDYHGAHRRRRCLSLRPTPL